MRSKARRHLSGAKTVIGFAAGAASFFQRPKILLLAAVVALFAVAAIPLLAPKNTPVVAANGTLKCYGSAGNYEPCVMAATASSSPLRGRSGPPDQLASWTVTTLYQQARWSTAAADEPVNWETSPPAAARSNVQARHASSPACPRKLIPCFFSALRKGLTQIASAAANLGQARPAREHL
jgi:hypothetical protein